MEQNLTYQYVLSNTTVIKYDKAKQLKEIGKDYWTIGSISTKISIVINITIETPCSPTTFPKSKQSMDLSPLATTGSLLMLMKI